MKIVINTSWKCQLDCPYCLLKHIKINRDAEEHPWWEWVKGITNNVPRWSTVDVAGGDPLLYPGLEMLLAGLFEHGLRWAITTNAMDTEAVDKLVNLHPGGCVLVNISDHPGNKAADKNIEKLRSAFPVVMNRVDHPLAGKRDVQISSLIPYQEYAEGTEQDHKRRLCDSGINHWVLDPSGDVFLCNVAMALGHKPIGNIFDGKQIKSPTQPFECDWGCSTCYTSVPGCCDVHQRILE